jgi:hypothetical protein
MRAALFLGDSELEYAGYERAKTSLVAGLVGQGEEMANKVFYRARFAAPATAMRFDTVRVFNPAGDEIASIILAGEPLNPGIDLQLYMELAI